MPLGARTLDTLMALVSFPNEVISKRDLMARVWPDVTVEEGSLRFHIAELRKSLGRRQRWCSIHHDLGGTRILFRGADYAIGATAR